MFPTIRQLSLETKYDLTERTLILFCFNFFRWFFISLIYIYRLVRSQSHVAVFNIVLFHFMESASKSNYLPIFYLTHLKWEDSEKLYRMSSLGERHSHSVYLWFLYNSNVVIRSPTSSLFKRLDPKLEIIGVHVISWFIKNWTITLMSKLSYPRRKLIDWNFGLFVVLGTLKSAVKFINRLSRFRPTYGPK